MWDFNFSFCNSLNEIELSQRQISFKTSLDSCTWQQWPEKMRAKFMGDRERERERKSGPE